MSTVATVSSVPTTEPVAGRVASAFPSISWASVLAGSAVAVILQIALAELCLGFGLSLYEPFNPASPNAQIAEGTAVAWILCAVVALFIGSWVAGRLAKTLSSLDAAIHGVLVWALGGIVGVALAVTAVGALAGGAMSLVGDGLTAAAQGAKMVAPMVAQAVPSWDEVKTQVKSSLDNAKVADGAGDDRLAAHSRLMELLTQSFSTDAKPGLADAERDELITLLAAQTGVSRESAQRAYVQWQRTWTEAVGRWQIAKAEAEVKAKEAAKVAKEHTAKAALWGFLAMLIGGAVAALGGYLGCCHEERWYARRVVTRTTAPILA